MNDHNTNLTTYASLFDILALELVVISCMFVCFQGQVYCRDDRIAEAESGRG